MGYVVICLSFGLAGGIVGRIKGSSFLLWFIIAGVVPFVGLLAAVAYRFESSVPSRPCPRCRRPTKIHDALCTRCGMELDCGWADADPASELQGRLPAAPAVRA
jgi:hypothetical protein